jgi:hypothetical protein
MPQLLRDLPVRSSVAYFCYEVEVRCHLCLVHTGRVMSSALGSDSQAKRRDTQPVYNTRDLPL